MNSKNTPIRNRHVVFAAVVIVLYPKSLTLLLFHLKFNQDRLDFRLIENHIKLIFANTTSNSLFNLRGKYADFIQLTNMFLQFGIALIIKIKAYKKM